MRTFLIKWLVMTLAVLVTANLMPGIVVSGWGVAALAALLLGLVNAFIRPILVIITLPITLLTLGLFLLVINALLLYLVAAIIDGFFVVGFGHAVLGSIVISIVGWMINALIHPRKNEEAG